MDRHTLTDKHYKELLDKITREIISRGPSDTSMDLLAQRLSMSKRTLYEIFGSKDDMLMAVLTNLREKLRDDISEIVHRSDNIMEIMASAFLCVQQFMTGVNLKFFHDMDTKYSHLRKTFDQGFDCWKEPLMTGFQEGIREGVFRPDANYDLVVRLLRVQMESLKRMEEFFPPQITVKQATSAIVLGMLRSVAAPKGMEVLDQYTYRFMEDTGEESVFLDMSGNARRTDAGIQS